MEQRRLRLGDILDDYCPRERRVTNHAVVAMIEEDVKQTRCTTCDAEHAYKNARVPARRSKKETPAALYKEVLAGMPETEDAPVLAAAAPAIAAGSVLPDLPAALVTPASVQSPNSEHEADEALDEVSVAADAHDDELPSDENTAAEYATSADGDDDAPVEGPVHRPLIRATLPRIEGQKDARPVPDFTVRQAPGRGNGNGHGFRDRMRGRGNGSAYGNGNGSGNGNGNRSHGGPRFQGNRSSGGRSPMGRAGAPSGFRGNGNGHGNGNGNKRGRGPR